MYAELHEIWRQELETTELQKLKSDFYGRAANYLKLLREEGRMLDKRTIKARLLRTEMHNARCMIHELIQSRYGKLVRRVMDGEKVPSEFLTAEEEKICGGCLPIVEAFQSFTKNLLRGQLSPMEATQGRRNAVTRILRDVPEIIGADMRVYGPFKPEDVASLPIENTRILIKQGLAEQIEVC